MIQDFVLDLREARRKSGLTQTECAQLVGISGSVLSKIENGTRMPSLVEICALSIIYGKSFESLFGAIFDEIRAEIAVNLEQLEKVAKDGPDALRYKATLSRLRGYLYDLSAAEDAP